MNYNYKLGIIGAGNMAKAIANGIVDSKLIDKIKIIATDPFADLGIDGIVTYKDNTLVLNDCEYILLAVKPQIYNEIAKEIGSNCKAKHIISIMAGITYDGIKKYFPNANVTRVMPNTPCKLKKGMTAIRKNDNIPQEEKDFVKSIFDSIGKTIYLEEELFHAVTAVSGSGPAYVYMFIEGMIESGVKMGMSAEDAKTCVLQTFAGSIGMVESENTPICDLINAVCSKGGTTIQAVESFRQDNLYEIIDSAMVKCRNRSEELGK